jgi:hypothetical protein
MPPLRSRAPGARAQGQGMNQKINAAEGRYMGLIASMQCVICWKFPDLATGLGVEVHHLGEGSSRQCNWLVAPLCGSRSDGGHHRGGAGLHGMGVKAFLKLYRIPHESEYGLLALVNEQMAQKLGLKAAA